MTLRLIMVLLITMPMLLSQTVAARGLTVRVPGVEIQVTGREKSGARIITKWCFTGGLATGALVSLGFSLANALRASSYEDEAEYLKVQYDMASTYHEKWETKEHWESTLEKMRSSEKRSRIWLLVGAGTGASIAPVQIFF